MFSLSNVKLLPLCAPRDVLICLSLKVIGNEDATILHATFRRCFVIECPENDARVSHVLRAVVDY